MAVKEPENIDARGNMLIASSLAGTRFVNSMPGAVSHAMADALGALYGLPHGFANAIMLPVVMDFNSRAVPRKVYPDCGLNGFGRAWQGALACGLRSCCCCQRNWNSEYRSN